MFFMLYAREMCNKFFGKKVTEGKKNDWSNIGMKKRQFSCTRIIALSFYAIV